VSLITQVISPNANGYQARPPNTRERQRGGREDGKEDEGDVNRGRGEIESERETRKCKQREIVREFS